MAFLHHFTDGNRPAQGLDGEQLEGRKEAKRLAVALSKALTARIVMRSHGNGKDADKVIDKADCIEHQGISLRKLLGRCAGLRFTGGCSRQHQGVSIASIAANVASLARLSNK